MKKIIKFYPHLLAVLGFIIVSLIYFYPVMQGKELYQSDIVQYTGMAKEQNDFRQETQSEPYWTNAAFGGMPTYQLGAKYPHNYVKKMDEVIRFLPRPADYLFLYFASFYVLLLVLRVHPLKSFFGALAFGFSTYLIIILGVGHNAKAHAIAYMPLVLSGFLLVFQKRYILGGLLTMFAVALEINANHFQMTYYLLLFLLILCGYYGVQMLREKQFNDLTKSVGVLLIAGLLAVGSNATNLMATAEYTKYSTRGKSELLIQADGTKSETTSALKKDYITEYSYGIMESLNLISPRILGGSNNEHLTKDSEMYQFLIGKGLDEGQASQMIAGMPTYWGDQPIVAAPAYIGAVIFFLAVLALFVRRDKLTYVFLAGAILALVFSWGKNFSLLTDFLISNFPMYDKFRAVSSIQVILELAIPVLALMGLQSFFEKDQKEKDKSLLYAFGTSIGLVIVLFLAKSTFSFSNANDLAFVKNYGQDFVNALIADRKTMFSADLLRSGFFITLVFGLLWMYQNQKLSKNVAVVLVGILMVSDLFFVDKNYVKADGFVSPSEMQAPFEATSADMKILQDNSHFRVFEVNGNLNSSRASYFHKSIGGYHAAKPRRMQQLFDYQISNNNLEILNMLNVKYVIQQDDKGQSIPTRNPGINGNAWFVSNIKAVKTADEEMQALTKFDSKKTAILNINEQANFDKKWLGKSIDTTGTISLKTYKPNYLKYQSSTNAESIAVFSEVYYKDGWNAYVDGKLTPHFCVNYVLRALELPKGNHQIEFKFEPQVVKTGSMISLASNIGMFLVLIAGLFMVYRKENTES